MPVLELQVLNGDQAGASVEIRPGSYRILRRSTENFDVRSTLVASNVEQWRLSQEDLELAAAQLTRRAVETGNPVVRFEAFERAEDISIWDQRMSLPHAIVLFDEDHASIVDMGSRNGTFVNGERVGSTDLSHEDLVRCGATRIQLFVR
ncbi:MAG: FHA domain-containing protein [Pseudomonadota bacterium]